MKLPDFERHMRSPRRTKCARLATARKADNRPVISTDEQAWVSRFLGSRNLLDCIGGALFAKPAAVVGLVVLLIGGAIAFNILVTGEVSDKLYAVIQTAVGFYFGSRRGPGNV